MVVDDVWIVVEQRAVGEAGPVDRDYQDQRENKQFRALRGGADRQRSLDGTLC
jgi:hypothetical protein